MTAPHVPPVGTPPPSEPPPQPAGPQPSGPGRVTAGGRPWPHGPGPGAPGGPTGPGRTLTPAQLEILQARYDAAEDLIRASDNDREIAPFSSVFDTSIERALYDAAEKVWDALDAPDHRADNDAADEVESHARWLLS